MIYQAFMSIYADNCIPYFGQTTVNPTINLNWGLGPVTDAGMDFVSIRWQGKIKPQFAETHTFFLSSDDGDSHKYIPYVHAHIYIYIYLYTCVQIFMECIHKCIL